MISREQNKTNQLNCPDGLVSRTWDRAWMCDDDRTRVEFVSSHSVGDVIFDFGCSDGVMCIELALLGYKTIGFNMNIKELEQAYKNKEKFKDWQMIQNCSFVKTDIEDISKEYYDKADTILCCEVLEHVFSPDQILQRIVQVGKNGSTVLITVPNRGIKRGNPRWELPGVHIWFYDKTNLTELLSHHLKDIKFYPMYEDYKDDEGPFLMAKGTISK